MQNKNFLDKVKLRLESLEISLSDISKLIDVPMIDINNFFNGKIDKNISNKITNLLGLDDFGNELIDLKTLKEKRAKQQAIYIVSLVQDSASLEMQGLDKEDLDSLIEETKQQFLTGEYQDKLWKK
jgi:hypothetical protein